MNEKDLIVERLHRNGLLRPFGSIHECVQSLSGIQSQFQQFAEISIFNRCQKQPGLEDLRDLYEKYGIINLWGQRHTLHMYIPEDWGMISDIYHDKFIHQNYTGIVSQNLDEMIAKVESEAAENRYIERKRLIEILTSGVSDEIDDVNYLEYMFIRNCCIQGKIFGVPSRSGIKRFASYLMVQDQKWRPDQNNTERSFNDLMKRYFQYYGPATLQDFCHWSGLTMGLAKNVFSRILSDLKACDLNGRTYYTHGNVEIGNSNRLFLLGKFDPLFVSYKHKDWIVTKEQEKEIWRPAALVESVVLDGTKVLGTWRHTLKGERMSINIDPMSDISSAAEKRIMSKAEKLAGFWKKELDEITYL